jgi:phosphoglycolate phosphatase-like HAD superfamily hydrolase
LVYIGWDADGVLVDSREAAWDAAKRIAALFGDTGPIDCYESYISVFGRGAQAALVGEEHSEVLRAMHRLVMRTLAHKIKVFVEVLDIPPKLKLPSVLATSAFAAGIRAVLGNHAGLFSQVRGREEGRKVDNLKYFADTGLAVYITDGVRDLEICKKLHVPTIAVAWGYTPIEVLRQSQPDFAAATPEDLMSILQKLSFL